MKLYNSYMKNDNIDLKIFREFSININNYNSIHILDHLTKKFFFLSSHARYFDHYVPLLNTYKLLNKSHNISIYETSLIYYKWQQPLYSS